MDQGNYSDGLSGVVAVVEDDPAVRGLLHALIRSVGINVEVFESVQDFLAKMDPELPSCLVLDVRLPGKNGLDFADDLKRANVAVPVVFISGYADVPMSVRAMKAGAVEFLPKPFRSQDLLDAIQLGIEQNKERRIRQRITAELRSRYAALTAREREVMRLVSQGQRNKAIAATLGIGEVTVKVHRNRLMRKMGAATLAEIIRMSDALDLL
jgi:FixJ family two-component response regulator